MSVNVQVESSVADSSLREKLLNRVSFEEPIIDECTG